MTNGEIPMTNQSSRQVYAAFGGSDHALLNPEPFSHGHHPRRGRLAGALGQVGAQVLELPPDVLGN